MISLHGRKYAASLSAVVLAFSLGVAHASDYKASTAEGPIKIVNLNDLEAQVQNNMEKVPSVISAVVPKMSRTSARIHLRLTRNISCHASCRASNCRTLTCRPVFLASS